MGTCATGSELPWVDGGEQRDDEAGSDAGASGDDGGDEADGDGGVGASPRDAVPPDERSVEGVVLTAADLPPGWEEQVTSSVPGLGPFCDGGASLGEGAFVISPTAFRRDASGGAIANAVHSFDSSGLAIDFVAAARDAIAACDDRPLVGGSGLRIAPETGQLGEEHVRARLVGDAGAGAIDVVRKASVVVVVVVVSEDAADVDVGAAALHRVVDRL